MAKWHFWRLKWPLVKRCAQEAGSKRKGGVGRWPAADPYLGRRSRYRWRRAGPGQVARASAARIPVPVRSGPPSPAALSSSSTEVRGDAGETRSAERAPPDPCAAERPEKQRRASATLHFLRGRSQEGGEEPPRRSLKVPSSRASRPAAASAALPPLGETGRRRPSSRAGRGSASPRGRAAGRGGAVGRSQEDPPERARRGRVWGASWQGEVPRPRCARVEGDVRAAREGWGTPPELAACRQDKGGLDDAAARGRPPSLQPASFSSRRAGFCRLPGLHRA